MANRSSAFPGSLLRKSVSQKIIDLIMDGMRTGEYRVGQRLPSEPALLQQWKISPASLRDAFKELETLGLISRKPRIGTIILRFEPSLLFERCAGLLGHRPDIRDDLIQMRDVVEKALVPLVCEMADETDWAGMQKEVDGMKRSLNTEELAQHDLEFHKHYYKATRNAFFIAMIPILVEYFVTIPPNTRGKFADAREDEVRYHARFLNALKSRNVQKAMRYTKVVRTNRALVQ